MRRVRLLCRGVLAPLTALCALSIPAHAQEAPRAEVRFFGDPAARIADGVVIPAGAALVWTSGIVAPVLNERAEPGTQERYGDTRIQAVGVLRRIEEHLEAEGLTLADVIYLRAFLAPDPHGDGTHDFAGWNSAYDEFFGTAENPVKPARATLGVASLVSPDYLIEIEAVAVYR